MSFRGRKGNFRYQRAKTETKEPCFENWKSIGYDGYFKMKLGRFGSNLVCAKKGFKLHIFGKRIWNMQFSVNMWILILSKIILHLGPGQNCNWWWRNDQIAHSFHSSTWINSCHLQCLFQTSVGGKFNCLTEDIKDDRCGTGCHLHNGRWAITTPINSNYSLVTRICLLGSSSELDIHKQQNSEEGKEDDANSKICQLLDAIRGHQSDVARWSGATQTPIIVHNMFTIRYFEKLWFIILHFTLHYSQEIREAIV